MHIVIAIAYAHTLGDVCDEVVEVPLEMPRACLGRCFLSFSEACLGLSTVFLLEMIIIRKAGMMICWNVIKFCKLILYLLNLYK
jgi:hypothetical protein